MRPRNENTTKVPLEPTGSLCLRYLTKFPYTKQADKHHFEGRKPSRICSRCGVKETVLSEEGGR